MTTNIVEDQIVVTNLYKNYGAFHAVNKISFSVKKSEIVGFLGVNGAGKTTTLRIIAGILLPSGGTVNLCGYDIQKNPEAAKKITGYIPDRPYLYPKLTAKEFLTFVGNLYGMKKNNLHEKIESELREFGLIRWQNDLIESFSHGMKQRLSTCAALIHAPKILIVDEPMVGLDPHGAQFFKKKLRALADDGISILLSTHSLNVAEELADRLIIIDQGNIIAEGTYDQIKQKSGIQEENLEKLFIRLTDISTEYEFDELSN
jgi:ABC-2 type transport system ATP-binding protein